MQGLCNPHLHQHIPLTVWEYIRIVKHSSNSPSTVKEVDNNKPTPSLCLNTETYIPAPLSAMLFACKISQASENVQTPERLSEKQNLIQIDLSYKNLTFF